MVARWVGITDLAPLTVGVMSAAGIKKAAQTGRVPAKKSGRLWLVDADSLIAREWIAAAKAKEAPEDVAALKREIARLNREVSNLSTRVRQAESSERRARRELEKVRMAAAQQTQQNLDKIYSLSEQVASTASQQTETMARALVQALAQVAPSVIESTPADAPHR